MACGTRMMPTIIPDITSPQMYSRSLYLGSQRTTGKKPVRVDWTLEAEQDAPRFILDFRAESADGRCRTCRSRRGGKAGVLSKTLRDSSMAEEGRRELCCCRRDKRSRGGILAAVISLKGLSQISFCNHSLRKQRSALFPASDPNSLLKPPPLDPRTNQQSAHCKYAVCVDQHRQ